jgi:hypothetical protein
MKKLISIEKFEKENSNLILNSTLINSIFGGKRSETNDWCQTLDDTCTNNRSDIHHVKSVDGTVVYDQIESIEQC